MPTFSRSLEQSLHRALAFANEGHDKYAAPEHLLLALIDDPDAATVMRACNIDRDKLRRDLVAYIEAEREKFATDGSEGSKPTAGLPTCNPTRGDPRAVLRTRGGYRRSCAGRYCR
jgi:ATP-dependent Clp protease ATP-binding subunit ClpA